LIHDNQRTVTNIDQEKRQQYKLWSQWFRPDAIVSSNFNPDNLDKMLREDDDWDNKEGECGIAK
jgi:hypothetical protein